MKHTFECGIVGESYDLAGDQFLLGMMQDDRRQTIHSLATELKATQSNMVRLQRLVAAMLEQVGGEMFVSEESFMQLGGLGADFDLLEMYDHSKFGVRLRLRKKS